MIYAHSLRDYARDVARSTPHMLSFGRDLARATVRAIWRSA